MKETFQGYEKALKEISKYIQEIGGSGRIHGCIIDIDWYNHIHLNLLDGTVTAYFAFTQMERKIYASVEALLKKELPELYKKHQVCIKENNKTAIICTGKDVKDLVPIDNRGYIYSVSNKMIKIQKLTMHGVICDWNDSLLKNENMIGGTIIESE